MSVAVNMKKASKALGIDVAKPKVVFIEKKKGSKGITGNDVVSKLEDYQEAKIALLFFDQKTSDRVYNQVKIACNTKICLHT